MRINPYLIKIFMNFLDIKKKEFLNLIKYNTLLHILYYRSLIISLLNALIHYLDSKQSQTFNETEKNKTLARNFFFTKIVPNILKYFPLLHINKYCKIKLKIN